MLKALVIDDEELARRNLKSMLNRFFHDVEIVGTADSVKSGIQVLSEIKTDIVFLDINLTDGSGFNLLDHFENRQFHVIFTTAYEDFAIRAFRVNAVDYLLKPISRHALKEAIERVKEKTMAIQPKILKKYETIADQKQKITVYDNSGIRLINISEILRCQASNYYTEIYLISGEKIVTSRTLKAYVETLEAYGFIRIHQSHLINLEKLSRIIKDDGYYAVMDNGDILEISRRKKEGLLSAISKVQANPTK